MSGITQASTPTPFLRMVEGTAPWGQDGLLGLDGPVTLYAELRVAQPQHDGFLAAIDALADRLRGWPGFRHLALKQMSGDSTMVKNYPEAYKGVLATACLDGVAAGTQPYFFSLFLRFADADTAAAADVETDFHARIAPLLHAAPSAQAPELLAYRGVYQTVAAGDRDSIFTAREGIAAFHRHPVETPERDYVTVANHVMVRDAALAAVEPAIVGLLKVAQQTFEPQDDPAGIGKPGSRDNRDYRKAVSTEILRNAHPDGELRAYLMHGVWESVWDHENSHIDPRFLAAAGPVGAEVVLGPVEPFYLTRRLVCAT